MGRDVAAPRVPYFHKREMGSPTGVYAKWHPCKEHKSEMDAFHADIVKVINGHSLLPFFSVVRTDDLDRFNAENELSLEPYPLAAFGCALSLASRLRPYLGPKGTAKIVFDRVEKVSSKLAKAKQYAKTDSHYRDAFDTVTPTPPPRNVTAKEFTPLQAADFLVWELQKFHLTVADDWYRLRDKPKDYGQRWIHKDQWSLQKYGTKTPPARKSLTALAGGTSPAGMIWDYDNLKKVHQLRDGVWS